MAINLQQIYNLVGKKKSHSALAEIMMEYAKLKKSLENTADKSWYFKKAIETKKEKLVDLNNDFEKIRSLFNENTIDDFLHKINKNNESIARFTPEGRNAITVLASNALKNDSEFMTELIRLKSKTKYIEPLDYYLDNPEDFLPFIE